MIYRIYDPKRRVYAGATRWGWRRVGGKAWTRLQDVKSALRTRTVSGYSNPETNRSLKDFEVHIYSVTGIRVVTGEAIVKACTKCGCVPPDVR